MKNNYNGITMLKMRKDYYLAILREVCGIDNSNINNIDKFTLTLIIKQLSEKYSVTELCKLANINTSTYYNRLHSLEKNKNSAIINERIEKIFSDSRGTYGAKRISTILNDEGISISTSSVHRRMRRLNLVTVSYRTPYNSYKGSVGTIAADYMNNHFDSMLPNIKWSTDVCKVCSGTFVVYLSVILDSFNNEVVSYNISNKPSLDDILVTVVNSLEFLKENESPILHSDKGEFYQDDTYKRLLSDNHIVRSMFRGNGPHKNPIIESFFSIVKREFVATNKFKTKQSLVDGLHAYIDYYNNLRINYKTGNMSPVAYRLNYYAKNDK